MAIDQAQGRKSLEGFFQSGDIPDQNHFKALIHSGINQLDDGIQKSVDSALHVTGPEENDVRHLIEFFETFGETSHFKMSLVNTGSAIGLNISPDGKIVSDEGNGTIKNWFMSREDGRVGIGTINPSAELEVIGTIKSDSVTGKINPELGVGNGLTFLDNLNNRNKKAQIHFFTRAGNNANNTLELRVDGNTSDHIVLNPTGNVGIGVGNPATKLQVNGDVRGTSFIGQIRPTAGKGENSGILFPRDPGGGVGDRAWMRYYSRSKQHMTLEIGVSNNSSDHIALMPSGNVGIGIIDPTSKLHIDGDAKATSFFGQILPTDGNTERDGILFPGDPKGGVGDRAWMRYYSRSGQRMTLEIGVSNNSSDHIALMPSGNVGIGVIDPSSKLEVKGSIKLVGNIIYDNLQDNDEGELNLQLSSGFGLGKKGGTLYYAARNEHSWRESDGINETMLLTTGKNGMLEVKGEGSSSFAGDLNVGRAKSANSLNLIVKGRAKATTFEGQIKPTAGNSSNDGIVFPAIPGGGSGDEARIQYVARNGGARTLEIGVTNDSNGHIALLPSKGNVGIGTNSPTSTLHVDGDAKATSFFGQILPTAGNSDKDGIFFPRDPGGGILDKAWMQYYSRGGQKMTLEIGVANNSSDHIALIPSGNVGIGTNDPEVKLDVRGHARATSFFGQIKPTAGDKESDGIFFSRDPGRGILDKAWMRYYKRGGQRMILEIGVANNSSDHIAFISSGNVGIGTINPEVKLDVNGKARAKSFESNGTITAKSFIAGKTEIKTGKTEIKAGKINIDGVEIGMRELKILKKLANNELTIKIKSMNNYVLENYNGRAGDGDRDRTIQFERDNGSRDTKMRLVIWE